MKGIEKASVWFRHLPLVERADWVWNAVRPVYDLMVARFGRNGLERVINGSDRILVGAEARGTPEKYEPDVWRELMAELRPGDTFVDVGAFIGLYAVAVGLRLKRSGRVVAFEPDRHNFSLLEKHVRLNGLEGRVELHRAAVSHNAGECRFLANGSSQACLVSSSDRKDTEIVTTVTLDGALPGKRIDILKIDVEGWEEMVLRGAQHLLRTATLRPRAIFIEVHPYAWQSNGSSTGLLALLNEAGYRVQTLEGEAIRSIERYGEIVARI
jgi:FkbM family methyltransferase